MQLNARESGHHDVPDREKRARYAMTVHVSLPVQTEPSAIFVIIRPQNEQDTDS
jgi:hypothetical protein